MWPHHMECNAACQHELGLKLRLHALRNPNVRMIHDSPWSALLGGEEWVDSGTDAQRREAGAVAWGQVGSEKVIAVDNRLVPKHKRRAAKCINQTDIRAAKQAYHCDRDRTWEMPQPKLTCCRFRG